MNFTETFPESVEYVDLSDDRARPRDLCRSFEGGICEGKVRLKDGYAVQPDKNSGPSAEKQISGPPCLHWLCSA